jgi:HD superfamily phosphodiesterase
MSSLDLFGKISSFVKTHLLETGKEQVASPTGPRYVFEHSLRVAFWCWRLALETHADVSMCVAAGLLHDVSHFESEKNDAQKVSAQTARGFMEKEGYKKEFMDTVAGATESQAQVGKPKTLETKVLHDADKIDEFGYFRLLLVIRTAGESFLQLRESAKSLMADVEKFEEGEYGEMGTSMGKSRINTQITTYKAFLKGLLEEIENTETTMR